MFKYFKKQAKLSLYRPRDISQALQVSDRRRQDVQRLSGVGFWELEHTTGNLYWSEEIFAIYDIDPDKIEPNYEYWASLIFEEDREFVRNTYQNSVATGEDYTIRYRVIAGDRLKWIEARGITYYDKLGQPERTIGTAQDISEVKASEEKIKFMAYHDTLTGLANRRLFSKTLDQALSRARQQQTHLAVLFIDLDNFKYINDHYGHDIGDEVLVGVAKKLQACVHAHDIYARIGGDEFAGAIMAASEEDIQSAVLTVKRTIDTFYDVKKHRFRVTASIGVTIYPKDDADTDILLRHADQAMYEAKEAGFSSIQYFDIERSTNLLSKRKLVNDVVAALDQEQFELYFQPRIRLSDGVACGAEALLRWFGPQEVVSPLEIIEAIKGSPQEWLLDKWVIRTVLFHVKIFKSHGLAGPFSLNVNPSSIENPRFPGLLRSLLSQADVAGEDIEIEILEVEAIHRFDIARETIEQCMAMGVSFSLDDFGTGYSSLSHFHALPVSKLKIDQRFVKNINTHQESLKLVKSILAIAGEHQKHVVAEGVESVAVAKALENLGCEFAQGMGVASPMPVKEYIQWAKRWACYSQNWPLSSRLSSSPA